MPVAASVVLALDVVESSGVGEKVSLVGMCRSILRRVCEAFRDEFSSWQNLAVHSLSPDSLSPDSLVCLDLSLFSCRAVFVVGRPRAAPCCARTIRSPVFEARIGAGL